MSKRKKPDGEKKPMNAAVPQTRTGKPIRCWIDEELGKALDRFVNSHKFKPSITSVVELAIQEFLEQQGFWPSEDDS